MIVDQGSADALTGAELARLCYEKYGLYHDMAIKCDRMQLVSDKKLVIPADSMAIQNQGSGQYAQIRS